MAPGCAERAGSLGRAAFPMGQDRLPHPAPRFGSKSPPRVPCCHASVCRGLPDSEFLIVACTFITIPESVPGDTEV